MEDRFSSPDVEAARAVVIKDALEVIKPGRRKKLLKGGKP
jgi:hypothetical protein